MDDSKLCGGCVYLYYDSFPAKCKKFKCTLHHAEEWEFYKCPACLDPAYIVTLPTYTTYTTYPIHEEDGTPPEPTIDVEAEVNELGIAIAKLQSIVAKLRAKIKKD